MNKLTRISLPLVAGAALTALVIGRGGDDGQHVMPEPPADAAAAPVALVAAHPFTLDQETTHSWRAEQPTYRAGYLLVLAVDRDAVHPRQLAEPVLYVGDQTAARINVGHESGFVVAVVPSDLGADGLPALDLSSAPIYFGTPMLPEEVDAATAAGELSAAIALGVAPPSAADVAAGTRRHLEFENDYQLHVFSADLVEEFSPMERDLITGLRAPLVGG